MPPGDKLANSPRRFLFPFFVFSFGVKIIGIFDSIGSILNQNPVDRVLVERYRVHIKLFSSFIRPLSSRFLAFQSPSFHPPVQPISSPDIPSQRFVILCVFYQRSSNRSL